MSRLYNPPPHPTALVEAPISPFDDFLERAHTVIHDAPIEGRKVYILHANDETNSDGNFETLIEGTFSSDRMQRPPMVVTRTALTSVPLASDGGNDRLNEFARKLLDGLKLQNYSSGYVARFASAIRSAAWHTASPRVPLADNIENFAISPAWRAAIMKVENFANFEQDWDGEDGHAPAKADIANAVHFLHWCSGLTSKIPRITPVGDGEIVIAWKLPNKGYLKAFFQDNELIYLSKDLDGIEHDEEYPYNNHVDSFLKEFISKYSEHLSS